MQNTAEKLRRDQSEPIKRKIIYIKNLEDSHHVKEHNEIFCAALSSGTGDNGGHGNFRRLLFSHKGGHGRAEAEEIFYRAMNITLSDDWI